MKIYVASSWRNPWQPGVVRLLREAPPDRCWNNILFGQKREAGYPWVPLGTHELLPIARADELLASGAALPPKFPRAPRPGRKAVYIKGSVDQLATHFRCWDSLRDAAWWSTRKVLVPGQRYATDAARAALETCDTAELAAELGRLGYFSANAGEYARALAGNLPKARAAVDAIDWAGLPDMSAARARQLTASADLGLWGSVRQSQQETTLADLERARRERDGSDT